MSGPLDYERPVQKSVLANIVFAVAIVGTVLSLVVVCIMFSGAMRIWYAGLFDLGVSFFYRLSMKSYHINWDPIVWVLPVMGIVGGVGSARTGNAKWGRRCAIASVLSALSMIAMDCYW